MARPHFDNELEEVRAIASRMASLVEDAIRLAMRALLERDRDLATQVVEGDEKINQLHHDLREEIFKVIATQAPVARDLRLLLGLQYIGAELERMGDYATRIAKRARRLADEAEPPPATLVDLARMGELAESRSTTSSTPSSGSTPRPRRGSRRTTMPSTASTGRRLPSSWRRWPPTPST